MKLLNTFVLASVLAVSSFAGLASAGAPTTTGSIVVLARHVEAKPDDPVKVSFDKFQVTKASFDPKKIEGGKVSLVIDATSLKTGSDKRDAQLNTADYLDTAKYPTIKIDIDGVKKKSDKTYTANATVKFRDVTKKYPITFEVIDTTADSVHLKAEVPFKRLDFKVGKDSKDPKVAPVVDELVLQADLTIKKG